MYIKLNQAHCNKASFKDQQDNRFTKLHFYFFYLKHFILKMNKLFINLLDKLISLFLVCIVYQFLQCIYKYVHTH